MLIDFISRVGRKSHVLQSHTHKFCYRRSPRQKTHVLGSAADLRSLGEELDTEERVDEDEDQSYKLISAILIASESVHLCVQGG